MTKVPAKVHFLLLFLLLSQITSQTTFTRIMTNGNWDDSGAWNLAGFPGSSLTQDTGIIDGGSFIINYDLTVGVNPIPVILLQNSAILQTSTPSTISDMTVDSGSLFVVQSSVLSNIPGATVLVNTDSNIKGTGSSVIDLSEFNLSISGNVEFFDSSIITIDNSFISIPAGCLQQFGNTHLTTNNTFYDAACTLQFHETSSFEAYYSFFDVSGMLDTFDEISFIVNHSDMTVDGMVMFSGSQTSTIQFKSSNFTVNNGEVMFSGAVDPLFELTNVTIGGGDVMFGDSTFSSFIASKFIVTGGNVYFQLNSNIYFEENSFTQISGGNLITSGDSELIIRQSRIIIDAGDVNYYDNSYISITMGCWNINGGNVYFNSLSSFNLFSASHLTISDGNFLATENSTVTIKESTVSVTGGNCELQLEAFVDIQHSEFSVSGGSAIWRNDSSTNIFDSSFIISGKGGVNFYDDSLLNVTKSNFQIMYGNFISDQNSKLSFLDSQFEMMGGSMQIKGNSESVFSSNIINIHVGSLLFLDFSSSMLNSNEINIISGNMQFSKNSKVLFEENKINILGGSLEFIDYSEVMINDCEIKILSGNLNANYHSNLFVSNSSIEIFGSFYAQEYAEVIFNTTSIIIDKGNLELYDSGSFSVFSSNIDIISGNLQASNRKNQNSKYITFSNSDIQIRNASYATNNLEGNMKLFGNVEVSFLNTNITIDGNLQMTEDSKLFIFEKSNFMIPNGVVLMDKTSNIQISGDSSFINNGHIFAGGFINYPEGTTVMNSGIIETSSLLVNCNANDIKDISMNPSSELENMGSLTFNSASNSCIDNMNHKGLLSINNSNLSIRSIGSYSGSTILINNSTLSNGSPLSSKGSLGGRGRIDGHIENRQSGVVMSSSDAGVTNLNVKSLKNYGTMYYTINSRNLEEFDFTVINSDDNVDIYGGVACICLNPNVKFQPKDRFNLLNSQTSLLGKFDQVLFNCKECPVRTLKRDVEGTCDPVSDYSPVSFSVFFETCGGGSGSNSLTSITPPYYVIVPVAVGIIFILVVVFGGALFIEERKRRGESIDTIIKKRLERMNNMSEKDRNTSTNGSNAHVI